LVTQAGASLPKAGKKPSATKVLDDAALADVFGIEMEETVLPAKKSSVKKAAVAKKPATAKTSGKAPASAAPRRRRTTAVTK
jgi:hypothetical protein